MSTPTDFETLARTSEYHLAVYRDLYLLNFPGRMSREAIDASVSGAQRVRARNPGGHMALNFISAAAPLADADVREYAARRQHEADEGCLVHATVIDGAGFAAAAMRGAITTIFMVSRRKYARKVFADDAAALRWVGEQRAEFAAWRPEAEQLVRAFRAVK